MLIAKEICDKFSDTELVKKTLANVDFLSCIYQRYEGRLLTYIRNMSSLPIEESEDILQEAFIKIWKNLNAYNSAIKLSSWIYRIVHNETVSQWRKKTRSGKVSVVPIQDDSLINIPEIYDDQGDSETSIQSLYLLLEEIPLKYKEVIVLKYFERLNYEEISDILKIPEGTVATRLNRARKVLKKIATDKELIGVRG